MDMRRVTKLTKRKFMHFSEIFHAEWIVGRLNRAKMSLNGRF
jgi:hypothetical protein